MTTTTDTMAQLLNQFTALGEQLRALSEAKTAAAPEPTKPRRVNSTAADRIRQLVLRDGRANMPQLQRELKIEKQAAHYYAGQLAANGQLVLVHAPHEASHSTVKEVWDPRRVVMLTKERFPVPPSHEDVEAALDLVLAERARGNTARKTG